MFFRKDKNMLFSVLGVQVRLSRCYLNLLLFVPNCRGGGGWDQIANFGEKNPQVHLIIIRE